MEEPQQQRQQQSSFRHQNDTVDDDTRDAVMTGSPLSVEGARMVARPLSPEDDHDMPPQQEQQHEEEEEAMDAQAAHAAAHVAALPRNTQGTSRRNVAVEEALMGVGDAAVEATDATGQLVQERFLQFLTAWYVPKGQR